LHVVVVIAVVVTVSSLLWIITGLWSNAVSFGWALLQTGLISWVALYCLYCFCFVRCTKFCISILTKNYLNCFLQMPDFTGKMHQIRFRLGLRPRPHWGSWQRSPRPPSCWGGAGSKNPTPHSALRASILRPSGYDDSPSPVLWRC